MTEEQLCKGKDLLKKIVRYTEISQLSIESNEMRDFIGDYMKENKWFQARVANMVKEKINKELADLKAEFEAL